jgi:hypothetical protein
MAARTSTGLGVGIAVTLLGIATLGLFVTTIIMWSQASAQRKRADEQEQRTAEFIREDERGQDRVVRLKEQAKTGRKSLVGYLIDTQADTMQSITGAKTDTLKDLQSESKFGAAAGTTSVLSLYKSAQSEIESLKAEVKQAKADAERARQDQVNEVKRVKTIDENMKTTLAANTAEVDKYKNEVDALRESINDYRKKSDERVQKIADEAAAKEASLQGQIDTLQREAVLDKGLIIRMQGELKGKRFEGASEYSLVDAQVIGMNSGDNTATINIGRNDKLRVGMTFEVYSDATAIRPDEKTGEYPAGKASVEVVNMDASSATVRILREKRGNPMVRGDVLANAVYDPKKVYKFVIFGNFDANRDGRATFQEADDWRAKISGWGGKVLPDLSGETDYLILGDRPPVPPEPSSTAPVEVVEEWIRVKQSAQRYDELFKKASETSIPILNENRLRTLIGDAY